MIYLYFLLLCCLLDEKEKKVGAKGSVKLSLSLSSIGQRQWKKTLNIIANNTFYYAP